MSDKSPVRLLLTWLAAGLVLCCVASCGRTRMRPAADTGPDSRSADALPALDLPAPAETWTPDATLDLLAHDLSLLPDGGCYCTPPLVWLFGSCVPANELGQCEASCDVTNPSSCPAQRTCDPCAALASCVSSACKPACVPGSAMVFAPGILRISPTSGTAGQPVKIHVGGGEFYIGAQIWTIRLGSGPAVAAQGVSNCLIEASLTPFQPGVYAVEVAYGGAPSLAGFFTASGGVTPPPTSQPGYPCSAASPCIQALPYTCTCTAGRCACK